VKTTTPTFVAYSITVKATSDLHVGLAKCVAIVIQQLYGLDKVLVVLLFVHGSLLFTRFQETEVKEDLSGAESHATGQPSREPLRGP
jgi:uncharacterized membrane protein